MRLRGAILAALGVVLMVVALDRALPPPIERAGDVSSLVLDREGRPLAAYSNSEQRWRLPAKLDDLDPEFIERLISVEDARFYSHWGVDPLAVARATADGVRAGRVTSGASTITMQTARLLEPRPRTIGSKFIEALRALQIEARLSKREILELYLTLTPYGGNLEGVRAASLAYFGKEPADLDPAEEALLIALPQAPEARRPDRRPDAARAARARIGERLAAVGMLTDESRAALLSAPAPRRRDFPQMADAGARRALAEAASTEARSTLDANLQRIAEEIVRSHALLEGDEVQAAALIVEAASGAVRAHVGSAGRDRPGGWVDLTAASRSPGSTLKPFIYAMAFDAGVAAPETTLHDRPEAFGTYAPENFDRTHQGDLSARDALRHSLNVPAVDLLSRVGAERFAAQLDAAGAPLDLPPSTDGRAGLPVALGGAGLSLSDLALLYTALAGEGATAPLHWTEKGGESDGYAVMSDAAAAKVRRILIDAPSPSGRAPSALSADGPRVAIKTGTSWGFRDAWAAGVGGGYVVVVWVGRADGTPRPGATGLEAAAPLLRRLFDILPNERGGTDAPAPPAPWVSAAVSSVTGPRIVFPSEGAELPLHRASGRPVVLAGRGAGLNWYVNGAPLVDVGGRAEWRPAGVGFYEVSVVDREGNVASVNVRVFETQS